MRDRPPQSQASRPRDAASEVNVRQPIRRHCLVLCSDGDYAQRLRPLVAGEWDWTVSYDQAQFEGALARAFCAVIVSGAASGALALQLVRSVRGRDPKTPLVAVVPRDAELVRAISKYVDEVIWEGEEHALRAACARAQRGSLRDVSLQIRDAEHLTPLLRAALTIGLELEAPPKSIGDLTAAVGSHRTSLDRHWRRLHGDPETETPALRRLVDASSRHGTQGSRRLMVARGRDGGFESAKPALTCEAAHASSPGRIVRRGDQFFVAGVPEILACVGSSER